MTHFTQRLGQATPLFFDGGMGTMLQARGMPSGVSPELFGKERPDVIFDVHAAYLRAGAMVATTNTFGGTRYKLGPGVDATELNRLMAAKAREAVDQVAPGKAFVAGSVGPTGKFLRPMGELTFDELVAAYAEQIRGLAQGGADVILAETQYDLAEVRALAVAARQVCDLPLAASMTFEQGVSLTGTTPEIFAQTMENLGVDLIATNCSAGPEQMFAVVAAMRSRTALPILAEPNAGLPELVDGETVFRLGPDDFAAQTARLIEAGATCLGGCCGTTPEHIQALRARLDGATLTPQGATRGPAITSRRACVEIAAHGAPFALIGERINPTGKKVLAKELAEGRFTEALKLGDEQVAFGASLLDVNVGAPMVDEVAVLPELVRSLSERFDLPLCIDSANAEAVAAALKEYPGSPLVNSISGEPGRMEKLGPLCKTFGAPFILLPLTGKKLPETTADRMAIIKALLGEAEALGIPRRLVVVDALALTVSSKPEAAKQCMETIRLCRDELGLPTVLGLSNISFGLPARELVNTSFLAMAMGHGLSGCIANPSSSRLRETLAASEVLVGHDAQAEQFITGYSGWKPQSGSAAPAGGVVPSKDAASQGGDGSIKDLGRAVISGDKERALALLEREIESGAEPFKLVDEVLIPAITEVGDKYERKEYFLPQLLRSAEAMQAAFRRLKPLLEAGGKAGKRPVVIMATVEGDIHDIGKNIVTLILENHGFEVRDLGKDVAAEVVVREAEAHGAFCVGLSALMTTTMSRMEETIQLIRDKGLKVKVMVGGAVVTQEFADSIGADGYAEDAVAAARLARKLLDSGTS